MKKLLIILAIIVLLVGVKMYSSYALPFPLYPYIDTTFAKDFTWEGFNKIKLGDKKESVEKLLGKPLNKYNYGQKTVECWLYTNDGKLYPYANFSWYSIQVCFKNEIVESKPIVEFTD